MVTWYLMPWYIWYVTDKIKEMLNSNTETPNIIQTRKLKYFGRLMEQDNYQLIQNTVQDKTKMGICETKERPN